MASGTPRIETFDFPRGRILAGKFEVEARLGKGWEGEVYRVTEIRTGIQRAAKLFYPHRNERDVALRRYARKLDKLSGCPTVVQYHHSDAMRFRGQQITFLLSELVGGEILEEFVARHRGKRLTSFEALHLTRSLAAALQQIHDRGEYHGDLHDRNVLVRRHGVHFDVRLLDLYSDGVANRRRQQDDILDLVRLLYDMTGGQKRYAGQPPELKQVCAGLKRSLILKRFPSVTHLLYHLDSFGWDD